MTRFLSISLTVADDGSVTGTVTGDLAPVLQEPTPAQDTPQEQAAEVAEPATEPSGPEETDTVAATDNTAGTDTPAPPFEGGQVPDGPPQQV